VANEADHRLAHDLATQAGNLLLDLRTRLLADGVEASAIGAQGDSMAHDLLVGRLAEERPDDAVLSEESSDIDRADRSRLSAERVWIIDPLDGTREFREGRTDWAVHVALVENQIPTAGAVAVPALDALEPPDVDASSTRTDPPLRIVVSRTRPPWFAAAVADAIGATLEPMGSAGAKTMAVVRGDAEVYLHAGGLNEWDACAPAAVALEAGLHVSHIDGSPILFNQADTSTGDLLICRTELAATILAAIGDAESTGPDEVSGATG